MFNITKIVSNLSRSNFVLPFSTLKITTQNLLNAQFKQSNSFSDFLISDSKTFILPRIVLFSIGYNL